MQRIIRTGFIGCGSISQTHLHAVSMLPGVQIAAFCDVDLARAQQRSEQNGGGDVYIDYRDLLVQGDLDAVHIATPHYLHTEMSLAALKAEAYVLCEKPMAIHMQDARAMLHADQEGKLGVVFQNRYNQATVTAKRMLDSGELGALQAARASVAWSRDTAYYAEAPWRAKWDKAGGGSLINQAIHTVDLMQYLCGGFARIKGSVSTDLLQGVIEVEDNCHAVMEFTGGQIGLLHTSNSFGFTELAQLYIYCEKGLLTLQGDMLTLARDGETRVLHTQTLLDNSGKPCYGSGHALQIAAFYESVRHNAPVALNAHQGYPATWAVLGIYESSKTDRWIPYDMP